MKKPPHKNNKLLILLDIGYILFKDVPSRILPKPKWIKAKLDTAGIRISYRVYMSAALFWTIVIPALTYAIIPYTMDLGSLN